MDFRNVWVRQRMITGIIGVILNLKRQLMQRRGHESEVRENNSPSSTALGTAFSFPSL